MILKVLLQVATTKCMFLCTNADVFLGAFNTRRLVVTHLDDDDRAITDVVHVQVVQICILLIRNGVVVL